MSSKTGLKARSVPAGISQTCVGASEESYDEETAEVGGDEMTRVEQRHRADHVAVAAQNLHARACLQVPDLGGRGDTSPPAR